MQGDTDRSEISSQLTVSAQKSSIDFGKHDAWIQKIEASFARPNGRGASNNTLSLTEPPVDEQSNTFAGKLFRKCCNLVLGAAHHWIDAEHALPRFQRRLL